MGLRTSISVLVVGLVLALAVTLHVDRVDLSAVGWSLVVGAAVGLLISVVQRARHQPYAEWYAIGPWLLIVGLVGTQAVTLPPVTGVDLFTVAFIVLVLGIVVTLAALYVVSPLRISETMRSYWQSPGSVEADPTAYRHQPHQQSYQPPQPGYDEPPGYVERPAPGYAEPPRNEPTRPNSRYDDGGEPPTQQLPRQ